MLHEEITERILKSAFKVHSALGAGLLESTYSTCLYYEFSMEGLQCENQVRLPIVYQGMQLDAGYRLTILSKIASSSN
jgi:GxxExxY protein